MSNINFDPSSGGITPHSPQAGGPAGPVSPGFGATSGAAGGKKPSPMELAASTAQAPESEYAKPPLPSPSEAPKSPIPPGSNGTLGDLAIDGDQLTISLTMDIGNKWWDQKYDYTATVTPGQIAQLQHSGAKDLATALKGIVPPLQFECSDTSNVLTHFPANMALFAQEFPEEYAKFMNNIALQIFQQVHAQQEQAMNQMKKASQRKS